jgi:hypothetical protein
MRKTQPGEDADQCLRHLWHAGKAKAFLGIFNLKNQSIKERRKNSLPSGRFSSGLTGFCYLEHLRKLRGKTI